MVKLLIAVLLLSVPSLATLGVDISQLVSTSAYSCLSSNDYSFAIPRGYQSSGNVDPNVVSNIKNAKAGGIEYVDVYLFPCVPCGNPAGQASALVNAIRGQNYGQIWIDVETYAWSSSLSANQNFITAMVNQLKSLGQHVGIYTNYYNWQSIVGLGWTGCASLPLWYAHYDNNPSFSDFQSFGGWNTPNMKQYAGDVTKCGVGVDLNFY
jgi:GH25 family lysozyme M1 (1,4-beta-N-acetylmuramidase)